MSEQNFYKKEDDLEQKIEAIIYKKLYDEPLAFPSFPSTPTGFPSNPYDVANKHYVDENRPVTFDFGDGSDGDVTISSNTTLTSDMYYNNLTVNGGVTLKTGGYRIWVKNKLVNNGTISNNGGSGGDAGDYTTPGAAGAAPGTGYGTGVAGKAGSDAGNVNGQGSANGVAGVAGDNKSNCLIGNGAAGGAGGDTGGGTGGAAGAGGTATAATNKPFAHTQLITLLDFIGGSNPTKYEAATGAGSGGGGGCWAEDTGNGASGGSGGGSGGSGGLVAIYAKYLENNGAITSHGGNGGAGGAADCKSEPNSHGGGGGGGAGGSGGLMVLVYHKKTGQGTTTVSGGTGGSGGSGCGTSGSDGSDGSNGTAGKIISIQA